MTSTNQPNAKREAATDSGLVEKLAAVLPKGLKFGIYHLSTPPSRTDALHSPPPGQSPDKTYIESHFLAVSIDVGTTDTASLNDAPAGGADPGSLSNRTLVLALEVFIFTTAYSTILFVSKADSTGYLGHLGLRRGTPSPIREVTNAFIAFLVEHRRRKGIQIVVSLFARAQSQYLFPGSADNSGKHVLDDRGLVKWWCRVLNPLLESADQNSKGKGGGRARWGSIKGYLTIPGLDAYETRAFLPRDHGTTRDWTVGHPLQRISHYTAELDWVPPRCLIPGYPDDPKCRFRDELDQESAKWKQSTGAWRSVKSLDQFWEMMAFRQECSSGRLTGFIWVVFDPQKPETARDEAISATAQPVDPSAPPHPHSTPPRRRVDIAQGTPLGTPSKAAPTPSSSTSTPSKPSKEAETRKKKKKLTGRIIPRQPHIKTHRRNYLADRPVSTAYYYWPSAGRGERIVDETDYKRMVDLLLHLDFSTLSKAASSTKRWVGEVAIDGTWGRQIVGTREPAPQDAATTNGGAVAPTNLSGLVRKKRPAEGDPANPDVVRAQNGNPVNSLGAGLVRKKQKAEATPHPPASEEPVSVSADAGIPTDAPKANVLGAGLVRRKPRPT